MIKSVSMRAALACALAVAAGVWPAHAQQKPPPTTALERFFKRFGGESSQIRALAVPGNAEQRCAVRCDVYVMAFEYDDDGGKRECASFIPLNALRFKLQDKPGGGTEPVRGTIDIWFHVIGSDRNNEENFVFADRAGMKAVHIEQATGDLPSTYPTPLPPNFSSSPKDLSGPRHGWFSGRKKYTWTLEGERRNTLAFKVFINLKLNDGSEIECEPFDPLIVNQ